MPGLLWCVFFQVYFIKVYFYNHLTDSPRLEKHHLSSTYYIPGIVLMASHILFSLYKNYKLGANLVIYRRKRILSGFQ